MKKYQMQAVNSCIVNHLHSMRMTLTWNLRKFGGLEPYQFEPKLADDEPAGSKTLILNAEDIEH